MFPIVNFPFISSNVAVSPCYGVYISQLIRYIRACTTYKDFLDRATLLTTKLLKQGYLTSRLKNTFKKFYGRHVDHIGSYDMSMSTIIRDIFQSL